MNQYDLLDLAFDFYNENLFNSQLPKVFFTIIRKKGMHGYFCPESFNNKIIQDKTIDEIAFNPDTFDRDEIKILATLVHEMCHLKRNYSGEHAKKNYHSKEWAAEMESVGLMPSDTESEGGKKTGRKMSHYIIDGGKFQTLSRKLLSDKKIIEWFSMVRINEKKESAAKNKIKYSCDCQKNIWGKPGLKIICQECGGEFAETVKNDN
jgi:hypothetical protein